MPTWFVGARLVIEGMPVCARSCSRGSSRAGGDQGVLLGLQSTSEDCEMELTWLPMAAAARAGHRSGPWVLLAKSRSAWASARVAGAATGEKLF